MRLNKVQIQDIYHKVIEGKVRVRAYGVTRSESTFSYISAFMYLCLNNSDFFMTKRGNCYKLNWSDHPSRHIEFSLEKPTGGIIRKGND